MSLTPNRPRQSPHHKLGPERPEPKKDGNIWSIPPRALDVIWGGDPRYWRIPGTTDATTPIELLQVSWLEVTGSFDLKKLDVGKKYILKFKVNLKDDAFGWADSPVYLVAKPGQSANYIWKKADLSRITGVAYVPDDGLQFKVPPNVEEGDKLEFGMYEIWRGRWKGGLFIHGVVIEPAPGT